MITRPGTWERVRTNAGWHLRLTGANGEPVVYGEPLEARASVEVALASVIRTALMATGLYMGNLEEATMQHVVATALVDVDERGTGA